MRKLLRKLLSPLLHKLAAKASSPVKRNVYASLSSLLKHIQTKPGKKGLSLSADFSKDRYIIFSDHHKGNKDYSDDFASNEFNYLAALDHYFLGGYNYINLGDAEEIWKYSPQQVIPKNKISFEYEAKFQKANRYFKTFGNHDVIWKNKIDVAFWFKDIFSFPLSVWEGIIINTLVDNKPFTIFLTHGHQGDKMSDNNGFSTWMVAHLWRPMQRYLRININTPAVDYTLRDKHNIMMHDWSSRRKDLILITGHTHKPVFASGLYSHHPNNNISTEEMKISHNETKVKPSYFNSGCCCYNDGDITGIEIADNKITWVKWHQKETVSERIVLEEKLLSELMNDLER